MKVMYDELVAHSKLNIIKWQVKFNPVA